MTKLNCARHKDRNATISSLKELPSINASHPRHFHRQHPPPTHPITCDASTQPIRKENYTQSHDRHTQFSLVNFIIVHCWGLTRVDSTTLHVLSKMISRTSHPMNTTNNQIPIPIAIAIQIPMNTTRKMNMTRKKWRKRHPSQNQSELNHHHSHRNLNQNPSIQIWRLWNTMNLFHYRRFKIWGSPLESWPCAISLI
jgi:hypothetical protein